MADKTDTIYGVICEIVRQETVFLRHYIGEVLSQSDDLNIGMVQVSIPELGWVDGDTAPWCYPRQHHGMSVPEVGEWVEVYFLSGDQNKPVYMGVCNEMRRPDGSRCVPSWFTGNPKQRVIFQSPVSETGILVDEDTKQLFITAKDLQLLGSTITLTEGGTEPFVLGTQLMTFLTTLVTGINSALASKANGAGSSGTLVAPSGILSTKIMGK